MLDPPEREPPVEPKLRFRIATPGVYSSGTAYRMDSVSIRLTAVLPARYPTDAQFLAQIERGL